MTEESNAQEKAQVKPRTVRRIAYMAVFIALSAVGAFIKIPSPVGTIALDSAPGYFSAIAFGYVEGISVIAIGHLLTSGIVGFPLGLPLHLFIAAQMALWAIAFRWIKGKIGIIPASIAAVILNGVVSSCTMFFMGGIGAVIGIMPFLAVGSAINVILAAVSWKIVRKSGLIK